MDHFHVPFGGDLIAHPILSFDFGPDGHEALSVETRREVGEAFTEMRERSYINPKARSVHEEPEFCSGIREGLPGYR